MRAALIWAVVTGSIVVSFAAAATSPLLAWRGPVYVVAGFAGVLSLALVLLQPLLAAGYLSGLSIGRGRLREDLAEAQLDRQKLRKEWPRRGEIDRRAHETTLVRASGGSIGNRRRSSDVSRDWP